MNNSKRRRVAAMTMPGPRGVPDPRGSRRARRHPAPAVAPQLNLFARRDLRKAIEAVVMQSQARG